MARGLSQPFDLEAYRQGHMTPVFFGAPLNNFGVRELLSGIGDLAPRPRPQPALPHAIDPARPRSPASSSRSRRTSIRSIATASPSCASARAASRAA